MTRKELLASRAAKLDEGDAIIALARGENRAMTSDEEAKVSALLAEVEGIDEQLKAEDAQAGVAALQSAAEAFASRRAANFGADTSVIARGHPGRVAPAAVKEFESFGEFVHAVAFRENDQRLASLYAEMRTDDGPSGGFALPSNLSSDFLSIAADGAIIRPNARVLPAGSPPDAEITIPALDQDTASHPANSFGGVSFSWIGEGVAKPATDAKLRSVSLKPHEIAASLPVTDKLLRNWAACSELIRTLFTGAMTAAEEEAFWNGTGVAKPLGFLKSDALVKVTRSEANKIKFVDLVGMVAKLLMRGGSPMWMVSQSILPQLMTIKDDSGNFIWVPNAREGMPGTLLGYPVRITERAEALGTTGDIVLVNLSYYLIKDGSGPFFASSEHVDFLSNKTWFKMFWNVDGASWLKSAFKTQKNYTVSPFVALT